VTNLSSASDYFTFIGGGGEAPQLALTEQGSNAFANAGADDLGNHTAEQDLLMVTNSIVFVTRTNDYEVSSSGGYLQGQYFYGGETNGAAWYSGTNGYIFALTYNSTNYWMISEDLAAYDTSAPGGTWWTPYDAGGPAVTSEWFYGYNMTLQNGGFNLVDAGHGSTTNTLNWAVLVGMTDFDGLYITAQSAQANYWRKTTPPAANSYYGEANQLVVDGTNVYIYSPPLTKWIRMTGDENW